MITDELKSHFLNMYLIAISDVNFDESEMQTILKIGEEKGISKEDFEQIIINTTDVSFKIPEDVFLKIEYLFDFARIIWADGKVDDNERTALNDYCLKFGFEQEVSNELVEWLLQVAEHSITRDDLRLKINELLNN